MICQMKFQAEFIVEGDIWDCRISQEWGIAKGICATETRLANINSWIKKINSVLEQILLTFLQVLFNSPNNTKSSLRCNILHTCRYSLACLWV